MTLIVDKRCSDVCCGEFLVYKLITKIYTVSKNSDAKRLFAVSMGKGSQS